MQMRLLWPSLALISVVLVGCEPANPNPYAGDKPPLEEIQIKELKEGTGPAAEPGDLVTVRYTGYFGNEGVFDSNEQEGKKLFVFQLGAREVIQGWDEGVVGMKVGGRREIGIPWEKAYGEQGSADIPPRADLYFEVELKDIVKPNEMDRLPIEPLKEGTGPEAKSGDVVVIDYEARLVDGELVDKQANQEFEIDSGLTIPGLNAGVKGMKVGGERRLTIPPKLAFGFDERGKIPARAKLIVLVTLKEIKKPE